MQSVFLDYQTFSTDINFSTLNQAVDELTLYAITAP